MTRSKFGLKASQFRGRSIREKVSERRKRSAQDNIGFCIAGATPNARRFDLEPAEECVEHPRPIIMYSPDPVAVRADPAGFGNFLDLVVQAMVCHLLADEPDAWLWRAAEMLFRRQRVSVQDGRVLSGDSEVLDMLNETGGLGEVGRLLMQGGASLPATQVEVLGDDNTARYLNSRAGQGRFNFVLDLTHEIQNELPHGLTLTMTRSRSGLKALAAVLEKWVNHFHGVDVKIQPEARVEDPSWRWHLGLDVESTALLNDLYVGHEVEPERQRRLISLFRLSFDDPQDMQADVRGKPVYLGLAMNAEGLLKLKPQNLLLNLPIDPDRLVPGRAAAA